MQYSKERQQFNQPISNFQGISFNATALGSAEQKDRVLSELLESFQADAMDFRVGGELAAEMVAFACDSLIKQVAAASGKRGDLGATTQGNEKNVPVCSLLAWR